MNRPKNMLIGEMLVEEGIITKEQLKDGLEEQKRTGDKIGQILIKMGYITKEILWTFLGYQMGVPFINMEEVTDVKEEVLRLLPEQLMRNEKLIPVNKHGRVITVAMADPMNFLVVDDLKATTRSEIDARLAPEEDIKKLIDKYFGYKEEDTGEIAKARVDELDDILSSPMSSRRQEESPLKITRSQFGAAPRAEAPQQQYVPPQPQQQYVPPQPQYAQPAPQPEPAYVPPAPPQAAPEPAQPQAQAVMSGDTPVNSFLTALLSEAYDRGATDVHIEPYADKCRIRRRIDGALGEVESPPKTLYNGILLKIKELARMNTAERNAPQESKLKIRVSGKEINMAVYTFPTIYGEKIVLKIVRAESTITPLSGLGMDDNMLGIYKKIIRMPHGLVLLAGPTGSGKTTTLYSSLSEINTTDINIFSIDDTSSSYILPGINQTKVNRKSYSQVLRFLTDQDCDVIAVGDVVNRETAEVIYDVVASGHLLFSKIRANDPYQALQAIIALGLEPYIVYSGASAVLAQRLVRKICTNCKEPYEAPHDILKMLGGSSSKSVMLYKGNGCTVCGGTGYKGRVAVFELLDINEKIRELLINKEPLKAVKEENKKSNGLTTLKEAALLKVIEGETSVEEYMKIN